jgi:hypothetical protein
MGKKLSYIKNNKILAQHKLRNKSFYFSTINKKIMNYVNDITLECLMNKKMYERLNLKNKKSAAERKERKFYRKRIIALTCEMLLNNTDDFQIENEDVVNSFRQFTKNCIQYFKAIDENDRFQNDLIVNTEEVNTENNDIINEDNDVTDSNDKIIEPESKAVTLNFTTFDYLKIDTTKLNTSIDL